VIDLQLHSKIKVQLRKLSKSYWCFAGMICLISHVNSNLWSKPKNKMKNNSGLILSRRVGKWSSLEESMRSRHLNWENSLIPLLTKFVKSLSSNWRRCRRHTNRNLPRRMRGSRSSKSSSSHPRWWVKRLKIQGRSLRRSGTRIEKLIRTETSWLNKRTF